MAAHRQACKILPSPLTEGETLHWSAQKLGVWRSAATPKETGNLWRERSICWSEKTFFFISSSVIPSPFLSSFPRSLSLHSICFPPFAFKSHSKAFYFSPFTAVICIPPLKVWSLTVSPSHPSPCSPFLVPFPSHLFIFIFLLFPSIRFPFVSYRSVPVLAFSSLLPFFILFLSPPFSFPFRATPPPHPFQTLFLSTLLHLSFSSLPFPSLPFHSVGIPFLSFH